MTNALKTITGHPWVIPVAIIGYTIERAWVGWTLLIAAWVLLVADAHSLAWKIAALGLMATSLRLGALTERLGWSKPFRKP